MFHDSHNHHNPGKGTGPREMSPCRRRSHPSHAPPLASPEARRILVVVQLLAGAAEELADRPAAAAEAVTDAVESVDAKAEQTEDDQRDERVGEEDCRKKVSLCFQVAWRESWMWRETWTKREIGGKNQTGKKEKKHRDTHKQDHQSS